MASSKRAHANMERELARALTLACEQAKSEIVGFEWLTHQVDYQRFPKSLVVTWMFEGEQTLKAALAGADKARMQALTLAAFEDIGITVADIGQHVQFAVEGGRHGRGH